jgi:hypothetical protein
VNLKPGVNAEPLTIEVERGVTLRRRVVGVDGKPLTCLAYARSYLTNKSAVQDLLPSIPARDGIIELPGFSPEQSNPLYLIDFASHAGATVSPTREETGLDAPPIRLEPCGSARFRFVTNNKQPLADHEPILSLLITDGAPATHHYESGQPLWADKLIWSNVTRNMEPRPTYKTDADGRLTIPDLIPGARYRLMFVKDDSWADGYEFAVRSGETVDVGEVEILKRD